MSVRRWTFVTEATVIPLREGRRVTFENHEAALFNLGAEYRAVENRCPHKRGPLADGIVAGKAVFCPLHNMKISLEHGCALAGGSGQVRVYPVKVEDGKVFIAFEEARLCALQDEGGSGTAMETQPLSADIN